MAIRNFWIDAQIDGRSTELTGGPQRKDGGFFMEVYIREEGQAKVAATIAGTSDGKILRLVITNRKTEEQMIIETTR